MTVIAWDGRTLAADSRVHWGGDNKNAKRNGNRKKGESKSFGRCKIQVINIEGEDNLIFASSGLKATIDGMQAEIIWHLQWKGNFNIEFEYNWKDEKYATVSVLYRNRWHIFNSDGKGNHVKELDDAWADGSGCDHALKRLKKGKDAIDSIAYAIKASARPEWLGGNKHPCGYPIHYWQPGMDMPGFIKGPDDIKKLRELQEKER